MTTKNPITVGGLLYPEFTLSLAISPLLKDNFLSASCVLSLQPMRRDNGELQILRETEHQKTLIYGDIFAANDMDVLICVGKIQAAIQQLIDKKGL